jgi:hypothetical protein
VSAGEPVRPGEEPVRPGGPKHRAKHSSTSASNDVARRGQAAVGRAEVGGRVEVGGATVGWHPEVLDGPLSLSALTRLDTALRVADRSTGLTFSVYIGELVEPVRHHAQVLHGQFDDPDRSVLLAISPNQRLLEIVTGATARKRILDRDCELAAMSMASAFSGGDLGGGIVAGLAQLAAHAANGRSVGARVPRGIGS